MIPSHFAVQRGQPQHLPSLHHMKCVVWPAIDVTMAIRKYFHQYHFVFFSLFLGFSPFICC